MTNVHNDGFESLDVTAAASDDEIPRGQSSEGIRSSDEGSATDESAPPPKPDADFPTHETDTGAPGETVRDPDLSLPDEADPAQEATAPDERGKADKRITS